MDGKEILHRKLKSLFGSLLTINGLECYLIWQWSHQLFFMLFYRVLKILGCNHGCHESQRPPGGIGGVGVQVPISSVETLRNRHSDPKSIIPFGNPANSEYFQRLFTETNLAISVCIMSFRQVVKYRNWCWIIVMIFFISSKLRKN